MKRINACFTYIQMLQNAGHFEFYMMMSGYLKNKVQGIQMVSALWQPFEAACLIERTVYKSGRSSPQTKYIRLANLARNRELQSLRRDIRYYMSADEEDIKAAALAIKEEVLDKYGRIEHGSTWDETAEIKHLVKDLTKAEPYFAYIQLLGMQKRVNKLEALNNDFETIYVKRLMERNEKVTRGTMRTLRPLTDKAFKAITDAIGSLYLINEAGAADEALRKSLNEIIDFINAAVNQVKLNLARTGRLRSHKNSKIPAETAAVLIENTAG